MTTTLIPKPAVPGDVRVVYGAVCTWWDSASRMATKPAGGGHIKLPCCPHCRGVLFEMDSIETWNAGIADHAERSADPSYPVFIAWLRGRCYRQLEEAQAAWRRHLAVTAN